MNNITQAVADSRVSQKILVQVVRGALLIGLGLANVAQATPPNWTYLGTNGASGKPYDAKGRPYALLPANGVNTIIDMFDAKKKADLLTQIAVRLPEGKPIGDNKAALDMLTDDEGANLFLKKNARVKVSYITEGAGYRNSVGFFKFAGADLATTAKPTDDKIMFPDYSSDVIAYGDTVDLGDFVAGDAIGFTISANGWNSTTKTVSANQVDSMIYRTIKRFNPETDINNQRAHTILFKFDQMKMLILGIEDLNRNNCGLNKQGVGGCNSDDDFNDAVLAVHVDPWDAVDCIKGKCDPMVPINTYVPIAGDSGPISWREITKPQ